MDSPVTDVRWNSALRGVETLGMDVWRKTDRLTDWWKDKWMNRWMDRQAVKQQTHHTEASGPLQDKEQTLPAAEPGGEVLRLGVIRVHTGINSRVRGHQGSHWDQQQG